MEINLKPIFVILLLNDSYNIEKYCIVNSSLEKDLSCSSFYHVFVKNVGILKTFCNRQFLKSILSLKDYERLEVRRQTIVSLKCRPKLPPFPVEALKGKLNDWQMLVKSAMLVHLVIFDIFASCSWMGQTTHRK